MSNNNSKIYNRFSMLSIIILIVMIVMVAGLSYAYIIKKIEGGDNTRVIIKTADIMLKYDEGNTLNAYNVSPGWEDEFTFSVENYSPEVNAKYKIILDILSPLSEKEDESFIYTLVSKSNKDNSEVNAPVNNDITAIIGTPIRIINPLITKLNILLFLVWLSDFLKILSHINTNNNATIKILTYEFNALTI